MKISVKVRPGAKENKIEQTGENEFKVSVKEPAKEGRANRAAIKKLAKHLGVSQSSIKIISGLKSKNKVVELVI